jgi:hypothetical protein
MKDLNDAALSALLRQNRSSIPSPTGSFKSRVIRAYERQVPDRGGWQRFLFRTLPVPVPIGAIAAATLLLIGFAVGSQIRFATNPGGRAERGRWGEHSSQTNAVANGEPSHSLGGLQVVAELRPRIIGGENENR